MTQPVDTKLEGKRQSFPGSGFHNPEEHDDVIEVEFGVMPQHLEQGLGQLVASYADESQGPIGHEGPCAVDVRKDPCHRAPSCLLAEDAAHGGIQ